MLAEWDEQVIERDPVWPRQFFSQSFLGLIGSSGLDVTPAVADSVNVGVYADARLSEAHRHHQVGGLPSDPVECQEFLDRPGDFSAVRLEQTFANIVNLSGLSPVESYRINCPLDPRYRQTKQALGRGTEGKEPVAGFGRRAILCPETEHTGN